MRDPMPPITRAREFISERAPRTEHDITKKPWLFQVYDSRGPDE